MYHEKLVKHNNLTTKMNLHNDDDNVNDGDIHGIIIMLAYNLHAYIMAVLGNTHKSPLTLDLTAMCTPGVEVLQPGASTQVVLPLATVANTVAAFDMSMPFVVTPDSAVEQPGLKTKEFPTLRLSESPDLLPSFGLSSSSSSPTLPWGTAEDSSPPFSSNRVREGHSQDVQDEGSLLSPGLVIRPPRGSGSPPSGGVLFPTTLEDFDD